MSDFQSRARAAAASLSSMNPAEALAQSLLNDRPTIDSAVKAYMSLTAARGLSASDPNINSNGSQVGDGDGNGGAKTSLHRVIQDSSSVGREKCFFVKSKNPHQASLLCARVLLKAINSFQIPRDAIPMPMPPKNEENQAAHGEEKENKQNVPDDGEVYKLEFQVVKIVWNGLVDSKEKKPSIFLGRKSLGPIYHLIIASIFQNEEGSESMTTYTTPPGVDRDEMICFMNEFGSLLQNASQRKEGRIQDKGQEQDDDSCLLWDIDGGKEELKRRRDRRDKKAKAAKTGLEENGMQGEGLSIEEIPEEEEGKET